MEVTVKNKTIEIESNSKPYLLKHILSDVFDIMSLAIIFFVLLIGCLNTGISNTYYSYIKQYTEIANTHMLESGYGVKTYVTDDVSTDGYIIYQDDDNQEYIVTVNPDVTDEQISTYTSLLKNDTVYSDTVLAASIRRYLMAMLSAAIGEIILYLIVPLTNKRRATCGQLLFGISLISRSRETYAKWYQVLTRFLLIFIFESCGLYLLTGIYTFMLVPVLAFIVMICNKNNRALRDYITGTMLIEKASYGFDPKLTKSN